MILKQCVICLGAQSILCTLFCQEKWCVNLLLHDQIASAYGVLQTTFRSAQHLVPPSLRSGREAKKLLRPHAMTKMLPLHSPATQRPNQFILIHQAQTPLSKPVHHNRLWQVHSRYWDRIVAQVLQSICQANCWPTISWGLPQTYHFMSTTTDIYRL